MSIRMAAEADIPQILDIYAPYILNTPYSFEYTVPSREEFTRRFYDITAQFPWLVWEEDGQILGYAYGSLPFERAAYRWCGEVSIYLHPDAHRRGIGRALYGALEEILRLQGYRVLYSIITAANHTSIAFHQALGYRHVARLPRCGYKLGQWQDVVWMEKEVNLVDSPSSFPLPAKDIVKNNRILAEILDKMSLS